ncbi:DUF4388 domain-containing protein [Hyalangium versicolor]|uniref:DUF4388 domain-containing protein n=1 Tax=Hyalangium versicolor TaxID=2861190 RepID=UPI001CCCBAE9|nr:DUF4388 domain-containing protein [Hyalangium versicolor]
MKSILVVAAEPYVRNAVTEAFRLHCDEFSIRVVAEAEKAAESMRTRKVDLLISVPSTEELDDFRLLAFVLNCCPRLPVMVMSPRKRKKERASPRATFQVPHLPMFPTRETLLSRVRQCLDPRMTEQCQGVTLPGLIQVLHEEHVTCRVLVTQGERQGRLHFLSGELVHARCGAAEGDTAALQMVGWRTPRVLLMGQPRDLRQTLNMRTSQLLTLMATAEAAQEQAAPAQKNSMPRTYAQPPRQDTVETKRQTRPWSEHANRRLNWWDKKPSGQWLWWPASDKPKDE